MMKYLKLVYLFLIVTNTVMAEQSYFDPTSRPNYWQGIRIQDNPPLTDYMIVEGTHHSYLLINNQKLSVGDSFSGGTILQITSSSIIVKRQGIVEQLDLVLPIKHQLRHQADEKGKLV